MAQNVTIAGNQYPSVPSIQIPKTGGGGNATFTDTSPTTASASDVAQGKIFFDSTGTQQTGTNSGGGGTDFIVTLSYDSQSDMWLPDKTFAEIVAAFTGGKTIGTLATYNGYIITSYGECLYDNGEYYFAYEVDVPLNYGIHSLAYILTSDGIYDDDDIWTYSTSDATALSADVANGKIFYNANGRQTGTASGGGGASNAVTGTFKGTTTGAAMDITLNYSGSGYPVAVVIYPKDGAYNTNSTIYSLVQKYACLTFSTFKTYTDSTPTYSSTHSENNVLAVSRFKSSSTSATTYQNSGTNGINAYRNTDASDSSSGIVKIKSATKLSVYIASTSYGFAANIDYTYWVLYSS